MRLSCKNGSPIAAPGFLRAASRPASRLVHRPEPTDATSPMRPLVVDHDTTKADPVTPPFGGADGASATVPDQHVVQRHRLEPHDRARRRRWPRPASGLAREPNPAGSSPAAAGSRGRSGWQTWPPSSAAAAASRRTGSPSNSGRLDAVIAANRPALENAGL